MWQANRGLRQPDVVSQVMRSLLQGNSLQAPRCKQAVATFGGPTARSAALWAMYPQGHAMLAGLLPCVQLQAALECTPAASEVATPEERAGDAESRYAWCSELLVARSACLMCISCVQRTLPIASKIMYAKRMTARLSSSASQPYTERQVFFSQSIRRVHSGVAVSRQASERWCVRRC